MFVLFPTFLSIRVIPIIIFYHSYLDHTLPIDNAVCINFMIPIIIFYHSYLDLISLVMFYNITMKMWFVNGSSNEVTTRENEIG
jgi:hypothetical protein